MVISIKIDIIGGGLSGLSTAISLKKLNKKLDVIVHEKYKEIGYNPEGRRCGEAHSVEREWRKWKPSKKSIFNEIYTVKTIVGDKTYTLKRKPGTSCILNRQEFISQLGNEAKELGAEIITNDKIKKIEELDGKYIIDASGCPSKIKKILNIKQRNIGITYQQTLENSNYFKEDTVKIFLTVNNGYFWIFPRDPEKKEINLGVGISNKKNIDIKKNLEKFKKIHDINGEINYTLGGLIPVGLQKPFIYKNILFVGDSGVGTMPITGEGIYRALLSGDIAARCIVQDDIKKYPYYIYKNFIKWQILGMSMLKIGDIVNKIGDKAVFFLWKKFFDRMYS